MKKQLAVGMAAVMLLATMTGCSGGKKAANATGETTVKESTEATQASEDAALESTAAENTPAQEPAEESGVPLDAFAGTTLTIAAKKSSLDYSSDQNEKLIFQKAEEATGIHIDWIEVDEAVADEKVSVMLASDMPDAFLSLVSEGIIAQNIDSFYDLSEDGLLETYAPNVVADIEASFSNGLGALTWEDGSIRSLAIGNSVNPINDTDGMMIINKAWLDQLNMEVPTTMDELHEVLCAFRDNDMNGNGDPTDEIPMTFADKRWGRGFWNAANFFGIAGHESGYTALYKMVKDGKVVPTADTEQWRTWLEWGHQWLSEGLLDMEIFSQNAETYNSKVQRGLAGVYPSLSAYAEQPDHGGDFVPLGMIPGMEGVEPVKSGRADRSAASRFGLAVSADCENVEALLHWWNYISSSTEMKYIAYFGEEDGLFWGESDGKFYRSDNYLSDPSITLSLAEYAWTHGLGEYSPLRTPEEMEDSHKIYHDGQVMDIDLNTEDGMHIALTDYYREYLQDEYVPVRIAPLDKTDERKMIETDLTSYINNYIATSVIEGVTDDSWDEYVSGLEAYGYYDWIQWYQDLCDGVF